MTNPTSNFGWQMPTNTDLVTDLPADFAVFGQAVDTSMADLLGGASGYILSKASATNMDFTWIANDQGDITGVTAGTGITVTSPTGPVPTVSIDTAVTVDKTTAQTLTNKTLTAPIISTISNTGIITLPTATDTLVGRTTTDTMTNKTLTSPVLTTPSISNINAKGDILVGTADNTLGIITAGNNGETLVADSSTSTGLRYQGSMAAGKNTIINGGMDIWQRGTASQTPSNGAQLNVDRFYYTGASGVVITQDTDVPTSPYFQYSLKTVDAANYGFSMGQKIEAANSVLYAGQTVTVSFWAKTTSGTATMIVNAYYPGAKDNFASLTLIASNSMTTPTATWTRFSTQFTLPSNVQNGLMILIGRGATTNTSFYTGVQLELGSVATSFQRAGGTIQQELAACQRYYYLHASGNTVPICTTGNYSTTLAIGWLGLPVTMRTTPTLVASSGTNYYSIDVASAGISFSAPTLGAGSTTSVRLDGSISGATAGQAGYLRTNNASSSIAFNSEL